MPENKTLDALSVTQKVYLRNLQADPAFKDLVEALPRSTRVAFKPRKDLKLEDIAYYQGLLDGEARIVQLLLP